MARALRVVLTGDFQPRRQVPTEAAANLPRASGPLYPQCYMGQPLWRIGTWAVCKTAIVLNLKKVAGRKDPYSPKS